MKIHKVAIIRNRPSEKSVVMSGQYTRCGIRVAMAFANDRWNRVGCKNCLRTKRRP